VSNLQLQFTIQNHLISLAIKLRIIDDIFIKNEEKYVLPYLFVGKLVEDQIQTELNFRNACNKIVHSMNFSPKTEQITDIEGSREIYVFYTNKVDLRGQYGKYNWEAEIDIQKFLFCAFALTRAYDENWKISCRSD